jgi:hypothetical protein
LTPRGGYGSACGPVIVPVFKTGGRQVFLSPVGSTPTRFRHFSTTYRQANHSQISSASARPAYQAIVETYPKLDHKQRVNHMGTLGTGNHFIEVCLDENENLWFLLHSGSCGVAGASARFSSSRQRTTCASG